VGYHEGILDNSRALCRERKRNGTTRHRDWEAGSPADSYHNCDSGSKVGLPAHNFWDDIPGVEAVGRCKMAPQGHARRRRYGDALAEVGTPAGVHAANRAENLHRL
jgi:hypothetical protein